MFTYLIALLTKAVVSIGGRLVARFPQPQPLTNQEGLELILLALIRDNGALTLEQFISWAIEEVFEPGEYASRVANWCWWSVLALNGDVDGVLHIIADYENDTQGAPVGSSALRATMRDLEILRTGYLPLARKAAQGQSVVSEVFALKPTQPAPVVMAPFASFKLHRN